ncbi:MAG: DUF2188 domain-containing protein [Candidatus Methanoplasma sp.]|jgi:hypothetical protein|nr:DUF2188 domain-containing protein [Candidatus Methanoplasma sp.]
MAIFGKKDKKESKEESKPVDKPAAKTETKKTEPAAKKTSAAGDKPKVWHITKREDDGKWQVKAEGAEKATKLFRTKAEAEEYVKTLKNNNEGSRVISHKKTGEFQKK